MFHPRLNRYRSFLFLLLFACFLSFSPANGEDKEGAAAQTSVEASLRKGPSENSPSLGRLPRGTILTLQGVEKAGFVSVSVELEGGNSIEGWISRRALSAKSDEAEEETGTRKKEVKKADLAPDEDVESENEETAPKLKPKPKVKVHIPRDEGVLLKRDPLFFYGLQAGGGLNFIRDLTGTFYTGPLFAGGVHFGIFLENDLPLSLEFGYSNWNANSGRASYEFAFVDIQTNISYLSGNFEVSLGLQYSYGISTTNIPTGSISGPADLSSVYIVGGLGYHIPISDVADFVIRLRYGISFLSVPLNFEGATLLGCLSFRG